MTKERMLSTSVQLTQTQLETVEKIKKELDTSSNAEVLRCAFDFYVKENFPEFSQSIL